MPKPTPTSGQPFPYDIWIRVSSELSGEKDRGVIALLERLPGFKTGFLAPDHDGPHSMRFRFWPGREEQIKRGTRSILHKAGATQAKLETFIVWRVRLKLHGATPISLYRPMTKAIKALPAVLDTLLGENDLSDIVVEFKGEPTPELMKRVRAIVAPLSA